MTAAAELRRRAQECLELRDHMSRESHPVLLSIAEAWLALAEQAERVQAGNAAAAVSMRTLQ